MAARLQEESLPLSRNQTTGWHFLWRKISKKKKKKEKAEQKNAVKVGWNSVKSETEVVYKIAKGQGDGKVGLECPIK